MGGVPIPVVFPVSSVDSAFDEAGNPLDPRLESRRGQFLDELLWYTRRSRVRERRGLFEAQTTRSESECRERCADQTAELLGEPW